MAPRRVIGLVKSDFHRLNLFSQYLSRFFKAV